MIRNILVPMPMTLCWCHRSHLIMSITQSQTEIAKRISPICTKKKRNNVKTSFHVFKVTTFSVMMVWNVLRAGKSWQVSPGIKFSLMRDKTLNVHMHSCILQLLCLRTVEAQGRGKPVWQDGEDTEGCLCKQAKWQYTMKQATGLMRKFRGCHEMYISQWLKLGG
jgi:hypothetical protein